MTNTCPIGAGPAAVVEVVGAVVVVVELSGAALLDPDEEQAPATSTKTARSGTRRSGRRIDMPGSLARADRRRRTRVRPCRACRHLRARPRWAAAGAWSPARPHPTRGP